MDSETKHTIHVRSKIPISRSLDITSIINKIHKELIFIKDVELSDRPESFTLASLNLSKDGAGLLMNTIFEVKD